ncbi:MAG TPA: SDR family oxidoreductase [Thermoleophilaceae bacterium]|nr:SDR family oxidoreductase [Thermoleophilaceae bacterium]
MKHEAALVTGGGGLVGSAVARALAARDVFVTLWGRDESRLGRVADEIGGQAARVDLAVGEQVEEGVSALAAQGPTVSLVVHCAGVWTPGTIAELDAGVIRTHLDAMVLGSCLAARAALRLFLGASDGHFVQIAAASAKPGFPETALNMAAKRAQDGLQEGLTRELRGGDVRLTTLYPDSIAEAASDAVATGAAMSAADVADAVLFAVDAAATVHVDEIVLTAPRTGRWE